MTVDNPIHTDRRKGEQRRRQNSIKHGEWREGDRRLGMNGLSDRRTTVRLPVSYPIAITTSEGEPAGAKRYVTMDVSARGVRVTSPEEWALGEEAYVCLFPEELFVPIQARGEILWRKYDAAKKVFQYGVIFKQAENDYHMTLELFLQRQVRVAHKMLPRLTRRLENFLYRAVLRRLIVRSQLGKTSIEARADSGVNFDHIYSAKPQGAGWLGKWVDHLLLHLPAAEASRVRKQQIQQLLSRELSINIQRGLKTRILDLGSGPSRYLLDVFSPEHEGRVEALCVDQDLESIRLGRQLAGQKPIRYLRADVFRLNRLQLLSAQRGWLPNVVILSGFIYYYDDQLVRQLFEVVWRHLAPGGLLICSNLINNPNRKLIGKLFVTQNGNPWIPLARPMHLVRRWLTEAGFEQIQFVKDPWGMYGVFSARRPVERVRTQPFEVKTNGAILRGKLFLPRDHSTCRGLFLFVHGLGYSFKSYPMKAEPFIERGYGLCVYNLRGHHTSSGEWTLENSVEDVSRVITALEKKIPPHVFHSLGVMAHSTGALIALLTVLRDSRIRFGSLINTVTSIYDSFEHWHRSGYNQTVKEYFSTEGKVPPIIEQYLDDFNVMLAYKERKRPLADLHVAYRYGLMRAGSFFHLAQAIAFSPDILQETHKITIPLILFVGQDDQVIPVDKTRLLYNVLPSPKKELILTSSLDHFQKDHWEKIQTDTLRFADQFVDLGVPMRPLRS